MNKLSWFLYLANLFDSLSATCATVAVITIFVYTYWLFIHYADCAPKPSKYILFTCIICGIIAIVVPSEKTMYMIAGSQIGEVAVNSEAGKRAISDIEKTIFDKIENKDNK